MQRPLLGALALLSVPALASFPVVDEVAFAPSKGLSLTTTFGQFTSFNLTGQEVSVTVGGEDQEQEPPDIGLAMEQSEHKVWTDSFEAVEDGQATTLKRTYDELGSESTTTFTDPEGNEDVTEDEGESELEGASVVFKWDSDDESYTVAFHEDDEDGDEDLLEELEFDAFLLGFLPEDEVSEGDTWEIELEAFNQLSSPGGDLAIIEGDEEEDDDDFGDQFEENLEGDIKGEYKGMREEDGVEYAVIFVTAELETNVEQDKPLPFEGVEGTSVGTYAFVLELEGELLWNVKAGHAASFTFGGDMELEIEEETKFEAPQVGEIVAIETRTMEGKLKIDLAVE